MKVEKVRITPDMARALLATSKGNRSLRKAALYTDLMKRGEWHNNGDTIRMFDDGTLQDGHNRLTAVIQSGIPMDAIMVSGLTKEAALTVDKGSVRTGADNILFKNMDIGIENANILTGAINHILLHDAGVPWYGSGGGTAKYLTDSKRLAFLDSNIDALMDSVEFSKNVIGRGTAMMPKSAITALHYLGCRVNSDSTERFMRIVFTGYGVEPETTADNLRSILLRCAAKTYIRNPREKMETCAKALRGYLSGRNIKHIGNVSPRQGEPVHRFNEGAQ